MEDSNGLFGCVQTDASSYFPMVWMFVETYLPQVYCDRYRTEFVEMALIWHTARIKSIFLYEGLLMRFEQCEEYIKCSILQPNRIQSRLVSKKSLGFICNLISIFFRLHINPSNLFISFKRAYTNTCVNSSQFRISFWRWHPSSPSVFQFDSYRKTRARTLRKQTKTEMHEMEKSKNVCI